MKKRLYFPYFLPALFVVGCLLAWEVYVRGGGINSRVLPAPSVILFALFENWKTVLPHVLQTSFETLLGFGIAICLGVLVALILDRYRWIRSVLYPLLVTSQTIPIIALAPLFLFWFGFDLLPKVIVVTLYCFFPIAIAFYGGLATSDNYLIALLQSMGASQWQIFWLVRLPGALPQFFSGLKIAATYAVTGAIVGEYVGGYQGLGIFMQQAANSYSVELVFVGIFITVLLSLVLFGIVLFLEHLALSYRRK